MTTEKAAEKYAEEIRKGLSFHASEPHEVAQEVESAFVAGAEYMRERIFGIYNSCDGDMGFVEWKLDNEAND